MPKTVNPALVEQEMQQYMDNTVTPYLNNMFGLTEGFSCDHQADRGDHIVINGRTVKEILIEEYSKTHDPSDHSFTRLFKAFYSKEGKALVSQRVAAAVMAGEDVDVYVPDQKTGRIKDTPARMTKSGYEPDPIRRPKQMTRWQKFWSKLGFYKDKVAEQQRQQAEYAKRDAARDRARDRVKLYNRASRVNSITLGSQNRAIGEAWGKKYPNRKDINISTMHSQGKYRLDRQGMAAYVNCVLARKKGEDGKPLYTNEQLFNMSDPKMQEARADAAEEIYQHNLQNDTDWLLELQHDSKTFLTERINEQGKKLDFSKPDVTEQMGYREYVQLSNTAFEISQEIVVTDEELDAKYGKGEHDDISSKLGELPNLVKMVNLSLESQSEMMNGMTGTHQANVRGSIAVIMTGQATRQHFAKMQKKQVPASEFVKGRTMDVFLTDIRGEAQREDDELDVNNRPPVNEQSVALEKEYLENHASVARQIATGVYANRVQLQSVNLEKNAPEPVKLNILDAKTAERRMNREQGNAGMEL